MVAIAIVGITSVSALDAVGGDMRTAERARRAIVVEALAGSRLEFMDLLTDRELQALPDSVESGKFPAPLDEYSWKTTSASVSDQPGATRSIALVPLPGSRSIPPRYQDFTNWPNSPCDAEIRADVNVTPLKPGLGGGPIAGQ